MRGWVRDRENLPGVAPQTMQGTLYHLRSQSHRRGITVPG
jgi:hypothetical protein